MRIYFLHKVFDEINRCCFCLFSFHVACAARSSSRAFIIKVDEILNSIIIENRTQNKSSKFFNTFTSVEANGRVRQFVQGRERLLRTDADHHASAQSSPGGRTADALRIVDLDPVYETGVSPRKSTRTSRRLRERDEHRIGSVASAISPHDRRFSQSDWRSVGQMSFPIGTRPDARRIGGDLSLHDAARSAQRLLPSVRSVGIERAIEM